MSISYKAQNFQHSMLSIKSRGKAEKGLLNSDKNSARNFRSSKYSGLAASSHVTVSVALIFSITLQARCKRNSLFEVAAAVCQCLRPDFYTKYPDRQSHWLHEPHAYHLKDRSSDYTGCHHGQVRSWHPPVERYLSCHKDSHLSLMIITGMPKAYDTTRGRPIFFQKPVQVLKTWFFSSQVWLLNGILDTSSNDRKPI